MTHSSTSDTTEMYPMVNLTEPWMATVIGVELDDTIKETTQVTLTSLCGSRLADTITMSIVLFPVHYRGDPVWQQRLEAIFGPEVPHFHAGMTVMAKYAQSLFNL
jgi:hypothetical protein